MVWENGNIVSVHPLSRHALSISKENPTRILSANKLKKKKGIPIHSNLVSDQIRVHDQTDCSIDLIHTLSHPISSSSPVKIRQITHI